MALICAALLAGCLPADFGGGLQLGSDRAQARGIRAVSVLDGGFRVRTPDGYCIDRQASNTGDGFVVMAGCALVSNTDIMPDLAALITVQVGATGSAIVAGAETDLAAFVESEGGKALLSQTGDASEIDVRFVQSATNLVEVWFTDEGPDRFDGLEPMQGRAFLDVNGHLVTVNVRGYSRDPISRRQSARLLLLTVDALRAANAGDNPA
ncbi:hypothetical protein EU803_14175 [Loktanella sp. IMCC34160]|uniref:hypothetical protein n=1 Tax=Loktanella sp. IMCC34160 TaxID=2510646 RepID=UPI00101D32DC|nr:hypothetical protein [Loktanella sp. IMCC34160]RYG90370.1 hypothetical protein EU803_14175 [Loktanella sp. IMCC34160]